MATTAGQHLIRVANAGREGHEVILMQLATGKTMDDMRAWLEDPRTPPPVSRVPDGRPHTDHGMIRQVRVE